MLKKYFKKNYLTLFLLLANFYFAVIAQAAAKQEMGEQLRKAGFSWGGSVPSGPTSLTGIVATVIQAFLGLLGIIFLILIIYAGYNWMTAQGDEEKVSKAKDTIQRAVIGVIIIIVAYAITFFVFSNLPGGDGGADITTE